jgi:hypothetical protein
VLDSQVSAAFFPHGVGELWFHPCCSHDDPRASGMPRDLYHRIESKNSTFCRP